MTNSRGYAHREDRESKHYNDLFLNNMLHYVILKQSYQDVDEMHLRFIIEGMRMHKVNGKIEWQSSGKSEWKSEFNIV